MHAALCKSYQKACPDAPISNSLVYTEYATAMYFDNDPKQQLSNNSAPSYTHCYYFTEDMLEQFIDPTHRFAAQPWFLQKRDTSKRSFESVPVPYDVVAKGLHPFKISPELLPGTFCVYPRLPVIINSWSIFVGMNQVGRDILTRSESETQRVVLYRNSSNSLKLPTDSRLGSSNGDQERPCNIRI